MVFRWLSTSTESPPDQRVFPSVGPQIDLNLTIIDGNIILQNVIDYKANLLCVRLCR